MRHVQRLLVASVITSLTFLPSCASTSGKFQMTPTSITLEWNHDASTATPAQNQAAWNKLEDMVKEGTDELIKAAQAGNAALVAYIRKSLDDLLQAKAHIAGYLPRTADTGSGEGTQSTDTSTPG